jgi:hypothetical protein
LNCAEEFNGIYAWPAICRKKGRIGLKRNLVPPEQPFIGFACQHFTWKGHKNDGTDGSGRGFMEGEGGDDQPLSPKSGNREVVRIALSAFSKEKSMRKISLRILGCLLAGGLFLLTPAWPGEEEDPEGKIPEKLTDKDLKDLARTAFVLKDPKGNEWLYIRLTGNQYALSKAKMKSHGEIRVILQPRQMLAVKQALKLNQPVDKAILRINEKHMYFSKGLNSRYIARSAPDFRKLLQTPTKEEKKEPANQPDYSLIEKIKSTS